MGGMAVPAVKRFGLGYLVGIDDAAKELALTEQIPVKYHYTGGFAATPEAQTKATTWYQAGVGVVFACGGSVGQSVMAAAENEESMVIGVDVNQGYDNENVITSAMKGLASSVVQALEAHYDGTWVGGETWNLDASKNGVGLPTETETWRFETFTIEDYNAIFADLAGGTVTVVDRLPATYLGDADPATAVAALDTTLTSITVSFEA